MNKYKYFAITALLLIVLTVILAAGTNKFYNYEKDREFSYLKEHTHHIKDKIYLAITKDYEYTQKVSKIIAQCDLSNIKVLSEKLKSLAEVGSISHAELIFPNDTVLTENGELINIKNKELSFKQSLNNPISGKTKYILNPEKQVIRYNSPIFINGEPKAVLSGITELSKLSDNFLIQNYDRQFNIYIIESGNGNILLNSMYNKAGRIENVSNWKLKRGYNKEQIDSEFKNMLPGKIIFLSNKSRDNFYAYYEPIGISDWMLMLTASEEKISANSYLILNLFFILSGVVLILFIGYFALILKDLISEKKKAEKQLKIIQYILSIEKDLFRNHIEQRNVKSALDKIADFFKAETAFFWTIDAVNDQRIWINHNNKKIPSNTKLNEIFPGFFSLLQNKEDLIIYDISSIMEKYPKDAEKLKELNVHNVIFIPVTKLNGQVAAMLGVINMKEMTENTSMLKNVSSTLSMSFDYHKEYNTLAEISKEDLLTGLMNQNAFLIDIIPLSSDKYDTLACIYIDVNGLHEINNRLGHQAGDRMLKSVANTLSENYGKENVYRIGGDEFAVLCKDIPKEDVYDKAKKARETLQKMSYEISIGIEWRNDHLDIKSIINAAEESMQEDKKRFYQEDGGQKMIRTLDKKNEKMLNEKRAADNFLNILAPEYRAVYIVELNNDSIRRIFPLKVFEDILKECSDRFSKAITLYAQRFIAPEDAERFIKLCNYDNIKEHLEKESSIETVYEKKDGLKVNMQIVKIDSNFNCFDTLWIFTAEEKEIKIK